MEIGGSEAELPLSVFLVISPQQKLHNKLKNGGKTMRVDRSNIIKKLPFLVTFTQGKAHNKLKKQNLERGCEPRLSLLLLSVISLQQKLQKKARLCGKMKRAMRRDNKKNAFPLSVIPIPLRLQYRARSFFEKKSGKKDGPVCASLPPPPVFLRKKT